MKKWLIFSDLLGALWMIVVLHSGSLILARVSNNPGVFATRWVHYRGIAPSSATVLAFNVWLVLSSSIEWMAVGFVIRPLCRHMLGRGAR